MLQLGFRFLEKGMDRLLAPRTKTAPVREDQVLNWKHGITVQLVRQPRTRRYLLGLRPDGTARLVIPRRGSRAEALRFLERSEAWLRERHEGWRRRSLEQRTWNEGTSFLFRGEKVVLRVEKGNARIRLGFADQMLEVASGDGDYRKRVLAHLRDLASRELPGRTMELARQHGITLRRVSVRAQKTRWGSCSARGTISLNWRLIQAPVEVKDYVIVHELMHRHEMNHSARYWKRVEEAFPTYRAAERWLKTVRLEGLE